MIYFLIIAIPIFLPVLIGFYLALEPFSQKIIVNNIFDGIIQQVLEYPTFYPSLLNTVCVVISSTTLLFILTFCINAYVYNSKFWRYLERNLPILLACPHVSMAIGFSFLLSPSGWLVRLFNFESPLNFQTINDPYGLSLISFFVVKELPFMLFMSIIPLNSPEVKQMYLTSLTMGYSHIRTWIYVIYPYIRTKLMLPLLIVAAYIAGNVDVSAILGMNLPPVFSVVMFDWLLDANTTFHGYAGFGFLVLLLSFLFLWFSLALLQYGIKLLRNHLTCYYFYTKKTKYDMVITWIARISLIAVFIISLFSLLSNFVWSFTGRWKFPHSLPTKYTLRIWQDNWELIFESMLTTIAIGGIATMLSLLTILILLESIATLPPQIKKIITILFLVLLLMPQIMVSYGISALFLRARITNYFCTTLYVHCLYSMAYMHFILHPAFEQYPSNYSHASLLLGKSRIKTFLQIKMGLMAKPLIIASVIGFSVSIAQYIPTLFLGSGRITTLPIETISVFYGSDRRLMGAYGLLLTIIPWCALIISLWLVHKKRN